MICKNIYLVMYVGVGNFNYKKLKEFMISTHPGPSLGHYKEFVVATQSAAVAESR